MRKLSVGLFFLLALILAINANAGEFGVLKSKIADARDALVTMLNDPAMRDEKQQKKVKETADDVSATMKNMTAPAGKELEFKELKDTWNAFKKTREEELVPLILKNKMNEAKKIGGGIQKDRLRRINSLCELLDK